VNADDDEVDGIGDAVRLNDKGQMINDNAWYDLSGRRVANGQQPTAKGLYIHNGRKEVVK
ncbi:MAG: hypothetical protein IK144_02800, partial [Bacteroidaceae bacterium]|nr:hypothetical protein [Bacteroidaceae bacterium]